MDVREILSQVAAWVAEGRRVALATLVQVLKSAPRQAGAAMAVNDRGEVVGSVSGGCVESALYEEAQDVLATGRPRLCRYGISDDEAFGVGLTCGGTIDIFIQRLDGAAAWLEPLAAALEQDRPVALATVVDGQGVGTRLLASAVPGDSPEPAMVAEAQAMLRMGATGLRTLCPEGTANVTAFIESFAPPPRMLVFGAIDFAAAAVRMGKFLGYRVTLCDARPIFATRARFPEADEVVVAWPNEYLASQRMGPRDAICVLTHDSKFDVPVLVEALKTEAGYIGAMGSRRTHERRRAELLEAGVGEADLARICSPVGLDIGGRTPEETAVSIAAELIALKNGRPGGRLSATSASIHATV